ncbi:MAG: hypothetical protein JXR20_05755 [Balneola sp.]
MNRTERKALAYKVITDKNKRWQKSDEESRSQKLKRYFDKNYDKVKNIEFKHTNDLNMEKYFNMPSLTTDWCFGECKNALALYPVLCSRADFYDDSKYVRISRENIGKLAGISTESVDKGTQNLEGIKLDMQSGDFPILTPLLQVQVWQDGKRRGYEYLPGFFRYNINGLDPNQWRGRYFSFYTSIIDSGVWASLSRKAKALYLSLRSYSYFNQDAYYNIENVYIESLEEVYKNSDRVNDIDKEFYRNRKWDLCTRSIKDLFELAKIPYRNTRELMGELERAKLIERVDTNRPTFLVYLKPKDYFKKLIS